MLDHCYWFATSASASRRRDRRRVDAHPPLQSFIRCNSSTAESVMLAGFLQAVESWLVSDGRWQVLPLVRDLSVLLRNTSKRHLTSSLCQYMA